MGPDERADRIIKRFPSAFNREPGSNNYLLARTYSEEGDSIERVLQAIKDSHWFMTTTGESLDHLAALYGLFRAHDETDSSLRARVLSGSTTASKCGTRQDIMDTILSITDMVEHDDFELIEAPNISPPSDNKAAFMIDLLHEHPFIPFDQQQLYEGLMASKAVGVCPIYRHRKKAPHLALGNTYAVSSILRPPIFQTHDLNLAGNTASKYARTENKVTNGDFTTDISGWLSGGKAFGDLSQASVSSGEAHLRMFLNDTRNKLTPSGYQWLKQNIDVSTVETISFDLNGSGKIYYSKVKNAYCGEASVSVTLGSKTLYSYHYSTTEGNYYSSGMKGWGTGQQHIDYDVSDQNGVQTLQFYEYVYMGDVAVGAQHLYVDNVTAMGSSD